MIGRLTQWCQDFSGRLTAFILRMNWTSPAIFAVFFLPGWVFRFLFLQLLRTSRTNGQTARYSSLTIRFCGNLISGLIELLQQLFWWTNDPMCSHHWLDCSLAWRHWAGERLDLGVPFLSQPHKPTLHDIKTMADCVTRAHHEFILYYLSSFSICDIFCAYGMIYSSGWHKNVKILDFVFVSQFSDVTRPQAIRLSWSVFLLHIRRARIKLKLPVLSTKQTVTDDK